MADLPDDFQARVRASRLYANMNRDDFAQAVGVSAGAIKGWEGKDPDNPQRKPDERATGETIKRLAKASGLPEWFFTVPRLSNMHESARRPTDERLDRIEETIGQVLELTRLNREVIAADLQALLQTLGAQPASRTGGAANG